MYEYFQQEGENAEVKEEGKKEEQKEEDEPGLWEENFKSFHDSKPHGIASRNLHVVTLCFLVSLRKNNSVVKQ